MKRTTFDRFLAEQLRDPAFVRRFEQAGEAWDVAMQIAALRHRAGLSQKEMARRLQTSQQQVSRIESPSYEGHSLSMLRRVAKLLKARVRVVFEAEGALRGAHAAVPPARTRLRHHPARSLSPVT